MQKGSEELQASAGGNREEKKKCLKAKEQAELTEVARQPQGVPGGAGSGNSYFVRVLAVAHPLLQHRGWCREPASPRRADLQAALSCRSAQKSILS